LAEIVLEHVTKAFGAGVVAVDDVSLKIGRVVLGIRPRVFEDAAKSRGLTERVSRSRSVRRARGRW